MKIKFSLFLQFCQNDKYPKCLISGNSTGTATVEVRDTRDNTICSTYNIVVYEAKINEVIGDIADGARKTISVNFSPTSLTVDEVKFRNFQT